MTGWDDVICSTRQVAAKSFAKEGKWRQRLKLEVQGIQKKNQQVSSTDYKRQPPNAILQGSKLKARTIIFSRHGMLECGNNFKGTMSEICHKCNALDYEDHRLNECRVFKMTWTLQINPRKLILMMCILTKMTNWILSLLTLKTSGNYDTQTVA